jgi:hypothetical protein
MSTTPTAENSLPPQTELPDAEVVYTQPGEEAAAILERLTLAPEPEPPVEAPDFIKNVTTHNLSNLIDEEDALIEDIRKHVLLLRERLEPVLGPIDKRDAVEAKEADPNMSDLVFSKAVNNERLGNIAVDLRNIIAAVQL